MSAPTGLCRRSLFIANTPRVLRRRITPPCRRQQKPRTTTIGGREYADWNYEKDGTTPVNAEAADAGAPNSVPESMLAQWDREGGREALLYQARSKAESILAAAGR